MKLLQTLSRFIAERHCGQLLPAAAQNELLLDSQTTVCCKGMQQLSRMSMSTSTQNWTDASPLALNYVSVPGTNAELSPLVFVHGLFGACGNFRSIMKQCSVISKGERAVYSLDLRNHGDSPHSNEAFGPDAMAADIYKFVTDHDLKSVVLVGHSLGGRAVMTTALQHPDVVERLMVVDMSPAAFTGVVEPSSELLAVGNAMLNLPLSRVTTRQQGNEEMKALLDNEGIRQWVLQNLVVKDGHASWRLNIEGMTRHFDNVLHFDIEHRGLQYKGPTTFLHGTKSDRVRESRDGPLIRKLFPAAKIDSLETGHWVHSERPREFIQKIIEFIKH